MAAMFSLSNSPGIHNVPVSMGLLGYLVLSCAAVNVPSMYHLHKYFLSRIPEDLTISSQVFKLVTAKLVFLDPKDLICAGTLVYHFREFERRYGSRKYATHLLGCSCLSFVLELLAHLIRWFIDKDGGSGILSSGPYGLLFPLFVNFYKEIPNTGTQGSSNRNGHQRSLADDNQQWNAPFSALGTIFPPISMKTIIYLFGMQLSWSSSSSFIAAVTGIVAGVLYQKNFLYIQKVIFVPNWLANFGNTALSYIVNTSPGIQGGNNNWTENGRWARVQHPANSDDGPWNRQIRRQGQGFAETLVYPDNYWMANQNGGNIFGGFLGSWRQHNLLENEDEFDADDFGRDRGDGVEIEELNVSEEEIQSGSDLSRRKNDNNDSEKIAKLVDMGFPKDEAQKALISTNYDLLEATNVLLRMETSQPSTEEAASAPSSSGDASSSAHL